MVNKLEKFEKDIDKIIVGMNDKVCMPYVELGKKEGHRCSSCFNWQWLYQTDELVQSNHDSFDKNGDVVVEISSVEYGVCDSFNFITYSGFLCFGYVVNRPDIDGIYFDDRKFSKKVVVLGEVIKKD